MGQKPHKNKYSTGPVKLRSKYQDHSQKFKDWVDDLGFEQTFVGKVAHTLDEKFSVRKHSLLLLYCLLLSFLLFFDFDFSQNVEEGELAASDLKSPITFIMIDEVATEKKRNEAEANLPPIFDFDPRAFKGITEPVYISFREMRALVRNTTWPRGEIAREEKVKDFLTNKPKYEELFGSKVSNNTFEWLVENKFNVRIENIIKNSLSNWTADKIIDAPVNVVDDKDKKIILKTVGQRGSAFEQRVKFDNLKDIKNEESFTFDQIKGVKAYSRSAQKTLLGLSRSLLFANVTYNKSETLERRSKARESVLPVQISIAKNQTIVNQGGVIQPVHVTIFNEIQKKKSERRTDFIALMTAMLFATLVLVFFSYTRRFTLNQVKVEPKDLTVMGIAVLVTVLLTKVFLFMTEAAFVTKYGLPTSMFLYAVPVASASMIVGLLITSGELVWLFTLFMSIVLSVMVEMNFSFFIVSLVGGIAGARGVYSCEKRNDIYWAGLRVGTVNAVVVLMLSLLTNLGGSELDINQVLWNVPAGFLGGVMSAMVAMALIPIYESLFNYTTDIKLLELTNLNHPLMQEMVVKAPGTYHHSLVVGSMVDAAAKEIGANALLGKVMAYYHDIGKMDHAQYFIENQRVGYNPHDHISPYMSKTILIAHVKDGAEMGLRHKLGKPIIDGILQHHGTTLISYFYNKALEEHDDGHGYVDESDFRYPGPKPQFKEAGILMLADSIEAAARSLDDPTPARLQNIVQSIIQNKFLDGQLSDCDLTLQDLSVIEEAFEHVILAIYHQRVEYPGQSKSGQVTPTKNVTSIKPSNKASS